MSLRKSPTLTPALLASNRRNASKSTVPRTARGKAISRMNRMRDGMRSREFLNFFRTMSDALPGQVGLTAARLLSGHVMIHGLFIDVIRDIMEADQAISRHQQWRRERRNP